MIILGSKRLLINKQLITETNKFFNNVSTLLSVKTLKRPTRSNKSRIYKRSFITQAPLKQKCSKNKTVFEKDDQDCFGSKHKEDQKVSKLKELASLYLSNEELCSSTNKVESKSPLYKMVLEDSIAQPHFDLKLFTKSYKLIQENVNRRKCSSIDVKKQIVDLKKLLTETENELKLMEIEIKNLFKDKNVDKNFVNYLKENKKQLKVIYNQLKTVFYENLMLLPNTSHSNAVELGTTDNNVIDTVGSKPSLENPLDHIAIGKGLGIFRDERLHEFTGSRNYILVGQASQLEQALVSFTLDKLRSKNFMMVTVPNILRDAIFDGCGVPYINMDSMLYKVSSSDKNINYMLAGTSEMGLCTYLANHAVHENNLPKKICAVSTCYRKETDSKRDPRGLYRVHQFTKVEMFAVSSPSSSDDVLMDFVSIQKEIISDLGLHARVLEMPCHELGLPAHRKIDLECWFPGRNDYGEVSSASDCTDYQAKKLQILMKQNKNEYKYAHTINGTACATTRIIMALMENGQQDNGTVKLPECLHKYMGDTHLRKNNFEMEYVGLKQPKRFQKRPK